MTEEKIKPEEKIRQESLIESVVKNFPLICKLALYGFGGIVIFMIGIKIFIKLLEIF